MGGMELPRLPRRAALPRSTSYHPGTGHLLLVLLGALVGIPSALVAVPPASSTHPRAHETARKLV